MRQAIITKYLGPTNSRGARVKASCDASSLTIPWDYSISDEANHEFAASDLVDKLWPGDYDLYGGSLPKNAGCCFVLVHKTLKGV